MPKRKRVDTEADIDAETNSRLRIQKSRLVARTDTGIKSLATALKLARGFERQKLGRRQKSASNEPRELLRLREEVICLRQLDLAKIAKNHLLKQFWKTKKIQEAPAVTAVYGNDFEPQRTKDSAEVNVLGRLFNSNPVKEVLPGILIGVRECLGIVEGKSQSEPTSKKSRKASTAGPPTAGNQSIEESEDEFDGFSEQEFVPESKLAAPSKTLRKVQDNEIDFDQFRDDLASASDLDRDEDGGDENLEGDSDQQLDDPVLATDEGDEGHVLGEEGALDPMQITESEAESDVADTASLQTEDDSSAGTSPDLPTSKPSLRLTPKSKSQSNSTAFLPSLTMGGYFSGSESATDLDEDPIAGLPQQRKNRRGQQERRKIAEMKYGQNAKHLAREKESGNRDTGWDAQRGATDSSRGRGRGDRGRGRGRDDSFRGSTGGERSTGANDIAINSKRRDNAQKANEAKTATGTGHPSWEAAKKRKEQGLIPKATGKKIVFD